MEMPEVCPDCRAMPVNDQTPPGLYRLHGECQCEEENTMKRITKGIIGPIIKDTYDHQCNGECKGNIHVIYLRELC